MLAAAWVGAGLFLASLAYFTYFYLIVLGTPAADARVNLARAVALNVALFSAFALHHSICARARVKDLIARLVPPAFERSLYVWLASLLFLGVCVLWQPLPGIAWQVAGIWRWGFHVVQLGGLALAVSSASRIDIWDLAGIRQARAGPSVPAATPSSMDAPSPLEVNGPYRWLRHPIYLGWVLFVFGAPTMTVGRLLFASVSTAYLAIAIPFEERSLRREFGSSYRDYQRQVRWRLLPGLW